MRFRRVARGIAIATTVATGALLFIRSTSPEHPIGDAAFIELYTLHSARGLWPFGPYSQFGWHHPGPMYFYLMSPLYRASGFKFMGLTITALLINGLSCWGAAQLIRRNSRPWLFFTFLLMMSVYSLRVGAAFSSSWNPHVIVMPIAFFLVGSAVVAAGDVKIAPFVVASGSFLIQTHIGTSATVVAVLAFVVVVNLIGIARGRLDSRAVRESWNRTAWVFMACWILPMAEEITGTPGNLTLIARFLTAHNGAQTLQRSLAIWSGMLVSLFGPFLAIPAGVPVETFSYWSIGPALFLLLCLVFVLRLALKQQMTFEAMLAAAVLIGASAALWSVYRNPTMVGDYHVFWMSMIGLVGWSLIVSAFLKNAAVWIPNLRWLAWPMTALAIVLIAWRPIQSVLASRAEINAQSTTDIDTAIMWSADAIAKDMYDRNLPGALIQGGPQAWAEQGGVVLELYKRQLPIAVDRGSLFMFGRPLADDGNAREVYVVDRTEDFESNAAALDDVITRNRYVTVTRFRCDSSNRQARCEILHHQQ